MTFLKCRPFFPVTACGAKCKRGYSFALSIGRPKCRVTVDTSSVTRRLKRYRFKTKTEKQAFVLNPELGRWKKGNAVAFLLSPHPSSLVFVWKQENEMSILAIFHRIPFQQHPLFRPVLCRNEPLLPDMPVPIFD